MTRIAGFVEETYERESTDYTVVTAIERGDTADGGLQRIETGELDRGTATLDSGGREVRDQQVVSPLVGNDPRISYYRYRDGAHETASGETAYRNHRVWIDATTES